MSSNLYPVSESSQANSHANKAEYLRLYQWSVEDPQGFWSEQGQRIDWIKPYTRVCNSSFSTQNINIKWFEDGQLNATYSCMMKCVDWRTV